MRSHERVPEEVATVAHVPIRGAEQFVAKVAIKKLGRVAARIDWKPDAASQASYERLRAGEAVDVDALVLAACNWSVPTGAWRDPGALALVDDPFLAPFALRYTPRAPSAALPLVLSAVHRLTRRLADARRSGTGVPARPA